MSTSAKRSLAALTVAICLTGAATLASASDAYPPVDRPGPALTVPADALRDSLVCSEDLSGATSAPVLLVPGTTATPREHFGWNFMPAFRALSRPYCAVTTPHHAMGDLQVAAEYVVAAIRKMFAVSGRRIVLFGASQGGSLPRWALRFWPDTRAMVTAHISLAATNHGGVGLRAFCPADYCAPAVWQQLDGSAFMDALNSGQETFGGISYTEIWSREDEVSTPATDPGSSTLHGGGGRIVNVALQDVCPTHVAEHIQTATYDPVSYALVLDALTHDGLADPNRIDKTVCSSQLAPYVDPAQFPSNFTTLLIAITEQTLTADRVPAEPALRCYAMRTPTCR